MIIVQVSAWTILIYNFSGPRSEFGSPPKLLKLLKILFNTFQRFDAAEKCKLVLSELRCSVLNLKSRCLDGLIIYRCKNFWIPFHFAYLRHF